MLERDADTVQVVLKLAPSVVYELDELRRGLGATSRAEVVRRAIKLLQAVQRAQQGGGDVAIITDGVTRRILVA
jgi:hypothetical protein